MPPIVSKLFDYTRCYDSCCRVWSGTRLTPEN